MHLTGFLSENEYQSLIKSVDIVIVFTTLEFVLNCGAYEGVSLGKPLILSNTKTIIDYFSKGVIHTALDARAIQEAILNAQLNYSVLKNEIKTHKIDLSSDWNLRFSRLENLIENLI